MTILQAIILGITQGITEFLPISSSAHLVIVPKLFDWQQQSLTFDIFVHAGTLAAIIYYYRSRLKIIGTEIVKTRDSLTKNKFLRNVLLTTIPAVLFFLLFDDVLATKLQSLMVIASTMVFGGALLIFAELFSRRQTSFKEISTSSAGLIGVGQGLSLIRGISRSGMMLTVGLFLKLDRTKLLEYVFLSSIPIITAGLILKIVQYLDNPSPEPLQFLFIGFVTAYLSGILGIHLLSKFLSRNILLWSGIYRIVLGVFIYFIVR